MVNACKVVGWVVAIYFDGEDKDPYYIRAKSQGKLEETISNGYFTDKIEEALEYDDKIKAMESYTYFSSKCPCKLIATNILEYTK